MMTFRLISDIIMDTVIIAVALYALWHLARHIREVFHDHTPIPVDDPADAAVWDVLAEARRITEEAGGSHGVTG